MRVLCYVPLNFLRRFGLQSGKDCWRFEKSNIYGVTRRHLCWGSVYSDDTLNGSFSFQCIQDTHVWVRSIHFFVLRTFSQLMLTFDFMSVLTSIGSSLHTDLRLEIRQSQSYSRSHNERRFGKLSHNGQIRLQPIVGTFLQSGHRQSGAMRLKQPIWIKSRCSLVHIQRGTRWSDAFLCSLFGCVWIRMTLEHVNCVHDA